MLYLYNTLFFIFLFVSTVYAQNTVETRLEATATVVALEEVVRYCQATDFQESFCQSPFVLSRIEPDSSPVTQSEGDLMYFRVYQNNDNDNE